jgi:hypothetical protein
MTTTSSTTTTTDATDATPTTQTTQTTTRTVSPDEARLAAWVDRARRAGHPILDARLGRLHGLPVPTPIPGETPPNDLLASQREAARAGVAWARALMPTSGDLLALGEALRGAAAQPIRTGLWSRLGRRGGQRDATLAGASRQGLAPGLARRSGSRVGAEQVGPLAVSETRDGVTVHVLEVPLSWLDRPITVIRRPTHTATATGASTAETGAVVMAG